MTDDERLSRAMNVIALAMRRDQVKMRAVVDYVQGSLMCTGIELLACGSEVMLPPVFGWSDVVTALERLEMRKASR